MFPDSQGATCGRLGLAAIGIKLREGAPSTERSDKLVYFRMASQKIGAVSLDFAQ